MITNLLSILVNEEPVVLDGSGVNIDCLLEVVEAFHLHFYLASENSSFFAHKRYFDRINLLRLNFEASRF